MPRVPGPARRPGRRPGRAHDGGGEDKTLGQAFIASAAAALRKGGLLWIVANRHLPYEAILAESFAKVRLVEEGGGYKVFEAKK